MKKLLLKDGSTIEASPEYGMRLIEQGEAVGFAPEKPAKAPKAEAEAKPEEEKPAEEKAAEPEKKGTPKKKGK